MIIQFAHRFDSVSVRKRGGYAFQTVALFGVTLSACGSKAVPDNGTALQPTGSGAHATVADAPGLSADTLAPQLGRRPRALSRIGLPKGPFVTFLRAETSCGLRKDGTIACFDAAGGPKQGFSPAGRFKTLDFHDGGVGCGIRESGHVACFGDSTHAAIARPPASTVRDISTHDGLLCWIDDHGAIGCSSTTENKALVTLAKPQGDFIELSCGWHSCCAVTRSGELQCFGEPSEQTSPPTGRFTAVAVETSIGSSVHASALTAAGDVVSWGSDSTFGTLTFPTVSGPFARITLHRGRVCALRADGTGQCSSFGCGGQPADHPGCVGDTFELPGSFAYFIGDCGVDLAGELACLAPAPTPD